VKTQSTKTVRWFFILALLGVLVLASCNRSATQGILPDEATVEETTVEDPGEVDAVPETSDTTMEALLDENMQSSGEGVEVQPVAEEADPAEGASEDTEQLTAEGETTSEPLSGEETATENSADTTDTETGAPADGTAVIVDVPVIGNAPATYIVQDGDWVFKIARTFNIAPLDLLAANPAIGVDQQVYPGQELIIPGGNLEPAGGGEQGSIEGATIMSPAGAVASTSNYDVQAGDTVFSIALNHGVTVDVLAESNDIAAPYLIYVGQSLVIPSE
jgi:LysM repeat protein